LSSSSRVSLVARRLFGLELGSLSSWARWVRASSFGQGCAVRRDIGWISATSPREPDISSLLGNPCPGFEDFEPLDEGKLKADGGRAGQLLLQKWDV